MKRRFDELERLRIEIPEARRTRHLAAIEEALATQPVRPPAQVWSRRVAYAALALAVALPAAIAAEDTVPGDVLYPVKRVVEPVRMLFDDEVAARHRVEELESLVDSEAGADVIDRQVEEARDALTDVDAPRLQRRFDDLVDQIRDRERSGEPGGGGDQGESDQPIDRTTTTTDQDRPPESDDPGQHDRDRDRNTTTTEAHRGDRPSDRPRDGG